MALSGREEENLRGNCAVNVRRLGNRGREREIYFKWGICGGVKHGRDY